MKIEVVRRIVAARHLFEQAASSVRSQNDVQLFSAVNSAQDAVELFLIAVIDHLGAECEKKSDFDKYIFAIEKHIDAKLPHRASMMNLNKLRVNAKHYGIEPSRGECERCIESAKRFFEEVSLQHLGAHFHAIAPTNLLNPGETRACLEAALAMMDAADYEGCLLECRKALYLEIESAYDISPFEFAPPQALGLRISKAPAYAKEKWFFENFLKEPTDRIVLDHARVDSELLAAGGDPTSYGNVRRLTPDVYRKSKGAPWVVKREFDKLNPSTLRDNSVYVLGATIDLVLALHNDRRLTRYAKHVRRVIRLRVPNARIFKKASETSEVLLTLPDGCTEVQSNACVDGLNGEGKYWEIFDMDLGLMDIGYVRDEDVLPGGPFLTE